MHTLPELTPSARQGPSGFRDLASSVQAPSPSVGGLIPTAYSRIRDFLKTPFFASSSGSPTRDSSTRACCGFWIQASNFFWEIINSRRILSCGDFESNIQRNKNSEFSLCGESDLLGVSGCVVDANWEVLSANWPDSAASGSVSAANRSVSAANRSVSAASRLDWQPVQRSDCQ